MANGSRSKPISPWARRTLVTVVIGLHLLGDLAAIPLVYWLVAGETIFVLGMLFGALLGQISLLSAYLAWGWGHWLERWCKSCLIVVLVWFSVTAGAKSTGNSFEIGSIEQLFAVVVGAAFAFLSVPYLALRGICRSRFTTVSADQTAAAPPPSQFGIRDLLIWTTAAAIVLATLCTSLGRELWGRTWSVSVDELGLFSLWMLMWAALAGVLAIPAMWACLGQRRSALRLLGLAILAGLITAVESFVLYPMAGIHHLAFFLIGLNLAICGEVVACSLLLRLCGYRLELCPKRRPA